MSLVHLLQVTLPTIVSTLCVTLALVCLFRLKTVKNKVENLVVVLICLSVAFWSFSSQLYAVSWRLGKLSALLVVYSTVSYAHIILETRLRKAMVILLAFSSVVLTAVLFIPSISLKSYSLIFLPVIYLQVVLVDIFLYHYYSKHKTRFHIVAAIMATFMILFGVYESLRPLYGLRDLGASPFGAAAFVIAAWFLIMERGYFNNKTWTDYLLEMTQKEKLLQEKYMILRKANISSIIILTQTIEAKDPYTRGHCLRVRNYSCELGRALGLCREAIVSLEYGALLHDIGKILIPGVILNKNGSLTEEEFEVIKKHPEIGANILKNVEYFEPIIPMIRYHHEFYNGAGYPDGLAGEAIPLEARILAVSDTYDALTSDRPYRKAMDTQSALRVMDELGGSQLDRQVVHAFISNRIYEVIHPDHEMILLDSGQ